MAIGYDWAEMECSKLRRAWLESSRAPDAPERHSEAAYIESVEKLNEACRLIWEKWLGTRIP